MSNSRVLILGINYAPESSGIAPYTSGFARHLASKGHRVRVLTTEPHYPEWRYRYGSGSPRQSCDDGVDVVRFRPRLAERMTARARLAFELGFGFRILRARWYRADVVFYVSPALFATALGLLRGRVLSRRARHCVIVQDLYSRGVAETGLLGHRGQAVMAWWEGFVLRRADHVVAIHRVHSRYIAEKLGVDGACISVIPNWTHLSEQSLEGPNLREELGWQPDQFIALHTGAMGKKQGLEVILQAARVAESSQSNVRFVLAGDGSERAELEKRGAGLANLTFLDPVPTESYGALLRSADVLLVCERSGVRDMAVPSKLTSYMAAGRPIMALVDDEGVTSGEIRDSGVGRVVATRAATKIVDALEDYSELSDAELARLGENGKSYCQRTFSARVSLAGYENLVHQLAGELNT